MKHLSNLFCVLVLLVFACVPPSGQKSKSYSIYHDGQNYYLQLLCTSGEVHKLKLDPGVSTVNVEDSVAAWRGANSLGAAFCQHGGRFRYQGVIVIR
ncbi:MAG: hypothetical protein ACE5HS_12620 [bacterium]